ncbi:MAG TPA: hypothetical protein VFP93_04105 [Gammaproteobacteria bacterium]|nr:hypothetical protein [Gammaproteobacteria bacterium]
MSNEISQKILLATPCHQGMCHAQYASSLAETVLLLYKSNAITIQPKFLFEEPLISRARNILCAYFLAEPSFTHLLFIDADIQWKPSDILRLINHNKPIIAATYPKKSIHWERINTFFFKIANHIEDKKTLKNFILSYLLDFAVSFTDMQVTKDGLCEVNSLANGFLLIQRQTLDLMIKSKMVHKTSFLDTEFAHLNTFAYNFFDYEHGENIYDAQEEYFSYQWRKGGGKLYLDLSILLTRMGDLPFAGYIMDLLQKQDSKNA